MRIVTISREFGSGGRELGKRMADLLGVAYYDKEIIAAIAKDSELDEGYVSEMMDRGLPGSFPITIGRSFTYPAYLQQNTTRILVAQHKIVKELAAGGDCVMMGQCANIILQDHHPLNIFVYADMDSKIKRCRERAPEDENLTDSEMKKKMRQIDAGRASRHDLLSNLKWGARENYHLCVNTSGLDIKVLAPHATQYAKFWLGSLPTNQEES